MEEEIASKEDEIRNLVWAEIKNNTKVNKYSL
jgi:hypothetical protein